MTLWWIVHSMERRKGYDKNAQPVQVLPRPVTKFTNTVIDLAMSVCTLCVNLHLLMTQISWHY